MKLKRIFSFFILFLILVFISFESYAAVRSSSNAVMSLPLDDDYGSSFYSSIGTVTNTIDYSNIYVFAHMYDSATDTRRYSRMVPVDSAGRFSVSTIKDDEYIGQISFQLRSNNLPPAGTYLFSFDFSSDFSFDYKEVFVHSKKSTSNASDVSSNFLVDYVSESGDLYVAPIAINLTNVSEFDPSFYLLNKDQKMVAGSFRINFTPYSGSADITTAGTNTTSQDAQIEISNNTTQILNTSNSIYESLQDLIQHISNQLAALWDQMYNLMHVPTMAKLDQILSAIQNINLDVTVDLDELKNSISQMSQAITGKVQDQISNDNANTDSITNGYDNSGMSSDKDRLDSSMQEYDDVENQLLDPVKEQLENFEFDTDLGEFLGPISDISYFLQGIFVGMGHMNVVVTFSLTLSVALILIGWYRFKGGS